MAKNTIKGITVEIGGDTTQLGKALEDVNKKSRDLSGELGEINKLLKFDPGNADILAQKQKVLADAVSNTKEKLDTLKEAEEQVQKQFERGEVSEEQVRALKREIEATAQKLKQYENAAEETAQAVDKLGKKSDDTEDELKDTEKGADKAADELDDLADSAKKAGNESDGLGAKLGGLAKNGLAAVTTGATALIGAMVGSAEATRDYRREMGKLDTAFTTNGHSTETATKTYKELQGILGETDQAVEAANHLAKLTKNEKELEKWTDICTGVYATFGASLPIEGLTEAANETAKTGALTGSLADALNWAGVNEEKFQAQLDACTSEQERQALIAETLNGLYSDAAKKYKETNAEVIRANQANEAWMSSMAEVGEAIEPILTDVKLLGASLVSDLVPGVQAVTEAFRGVMNGEDGSAEALGEALTGIFDSLLDKVIDMAPTLIQVATSLILTLTESLLGQVGNITRALLQILTTAIGDVSAALPSLISTLFDAAFGLLTNLFAYLPDVTNALLSFVIQLSHSLLDYITNDMGGWMWELVDTICLALEQMIPQFLQAAITFFTAIVQAIPVLIEMLVPQIAWMVEQLGVTLTDNIPLLLGGAVQLFNCIVKAIPQILPVLIGAIPQIIDSVVTTLINAIPLVLDGALKMLMAIVQAVPILINSLTPALPVIIETILSAVSTALPVLLDAAIQLFFAILDAIPVLIDSLIPALPVIIDTVVSFVVGALPLLLEAAVKLLMAIVQAIPKIIGPLVNQLPTIITTIVNTLVKNIPVLIEAAVKLFFGIIEAIPQIISELGKQLPTIITAIVKGLSKGISDIKEIGKDLVKGLWNGIKDMTSWITDKLSGFGDSVLSGIKSFFGIKSPSRVFRDEVGKMLALGLADGIEDNADDPIKAMESLSSDLIGEADSLNGLTLSRRLEHTFGGAATPSAAESGMLDKLDRIISAIEHGQVLTIDGKSFIGATADLIDSTLGQRRELVARGAI